MNTTESSSTTWNYFRREHEPDLWCAVRAHDSVPHFLLSGEWHFSGHRIDRQSQPPGFDERAARQSEVLNGFYLFQMIGRGFARP